RRLRSVRELVEAIRERRRRAEARLHGTGRRAQTAAGQTRRFEPRRTSTRHRRVEALHKVQQWASTLPDGIEVRVAVVSDDDMTHPDAGERCGDRARAVGAWSC